MPDTVNQKISELPAVSSAAASDVLAGVKSNTTSKFPLSVLKTFFQAGLTKSSVGLGNVDNTSDANKPVSTAQQAAIDGRVPTTRTVNGKALSEDITLGAADVGAAAESTLAVVEPSTTASISHAEGSYLVLGGILYEVTVAIAAGETITPGTNVTATTVTGIADGIAALLGGVVLGVYEVPANTTRNLSFIKEVKGGALIMSGGLAAKRGMYIYSSTSTGSVGVTAVLAVTQSGMSITGSGDDIVVVNGSNALFICIIAYKGALPTLTEPT